MILRCPRCLSLREGTFDMKNPPGVCTCGARAHWRVLAKRPEPGFVRVISDKGSQELRGPHFVEHPNGWKS